MKLHLGNLSLCIMLALLCLMSVCVCVQTEAVQVLTDYVQSNGPIYNPSCLD